MTRPASHYFSSQAEEARVTRVWAAVDARLERRRVRQRWLRPVALACAVAGVAALAWHANDPQRSSGPTVLEIADGSRVEHPRDARVEVMAVAPDRVELRLTRGRAQFSVQPNRQRSFLTHAGEYTVRVVGTVFSVELEPSGLQVGVTRGEVEVRRDGTNDVWRVRTGEHWTSNRLATAAIPQRTQATEVADAPRDHPAPASDQPGEPEHTTATPSAADASSPPASAQRTAKPRSRAAILAHRADHSQAVQARTRAARPVVASSSTAGPAARSSAPAASRELSPPDADSPRPAPAPGAIATPRDLSPSAASTPKPTPTTMTAASEAPVRDAATPSNAAPPRTQTADEPAALFQRAQQAREAAQPEEAERLLVKFLQLAPHDPRAGLAAFQLGRTRLELGDPRGALEALDAASHAGTAFTEQIQARRIQALEQLGQTAACRQARAAYLREFPDGAFGGIVRQRCQ